jgi:hypothetical protein
MHWLLIVVTIMAIRAATPIEQAHEETFGVTNGAKYAFSCSKDIETAVLASLSEDGHHYWAENVTPLVAESFAGREFHQTAVLVKLAEVITKTTAKKPILAMELRMFPGRVEASLLRALYKVARPVEA